MRIIAEPVRCADLRPGDLFSAAGPDYWSRLAPGSVGEKVYVRTETPCPPAVAGETIYRITVVREG